MRKMKTMDRNSVVQMAYHIIDMNEEIISLNAEVKELREYKRLRQNQDSQYVNDSLNGLGDLVQAINGRQIIGK